MENGGTVAEQRAPLLRASQAIAVLWVLWACLAHSGETLVGEWEDSLGTVWKQEIAIVELNGALYRRSTDTGGGDWSKRLKEMPPRGTEQRRFAYMESCCREQFAITADGDLNLYDELGLIRTAVRKGDSKTPATSDAVPRAAAKQILEDNAVVSDRIKDPEKLAGLFAIVIREYSFRCDTVSSITAQLLSDKWDVPCNGFRYSYVVYDRGGTWVAEYDD